MGIGKKSVFSLGSSISNNSKDSIVSASYTKFNAERDRFHKETLQRLLDAKADIESLKNDNQKLVEHNHDLEAKLKSKDQELTVPSQNVLLVEHNHHLEAELKSKDQELTVLSQNVLLVEHNHDLEEKLKSKDQELMVRSQNVLLVEHNHDLKAKLKSKHQELTVLSQNVLLLNNELSEVNEHYRESLDCIKTLQSEVHKLRQKNKVLQHNKEIHSEIRERHLKPEHSLEQEKIKPQKLELAQLIPRKSRKAEYVDPCNLDLLQKKVFLQKELQKRLDLLVTEDEYLNQREEQLEKLRSMLKRRTTNGIERPTEAMMECYRAIQNKKKCPTDKS